MASLIVQLARLGDLIQTLPAIAALRDRDPEEARDLLCPAPLTGIVALFPGITRVLPWDAERWRQWALGWADRPATVTAAARSYLYDLAETGYDTAYNLNQHPRAIVAAHLLARTVIGPGQSGALSGQLPAWGTYLRKVARERCPNHVHLADALCGMCGVAPLGVAPRLIVPTVELPRELREVGDQRRLWVAVIVGAGDVARCIPPQQWARWIARLLHSHSDSRVVLIGNAGERCRAQAIQERVSPLLLGRLWDATGRTDLPQLAGLLARCQWAAGSDTGSLHLAAALGCRLVGFYFARARVHETGPYGEGHWVWQASVPSPEVWPLSESLGLILEPSADPSVREFDGWALWRGELDAWGMSFARPGQPNSSVEDRMQVWKACAASGGGQHVLSS